MVKNLILNQIVKKAGQKMFPGQHWTFQQDSTPVHASITNQAWLRENVPSFITKWPPSPDLNPLNFSVWGILESKVGASSHGSIEALKKAFMRE